MSWTFVVLALVLFLFAIYIGFLCGQWACEKRVDHQARLLDRQFCRRGGSRPTDLGVLAVPAGAVCANRLARRLYRRS